MKKLYFLLLIPLIGMGCQKQLSTANMGIQNKVACTMEARAGLTLTVQNEKGEPEGWATVTTSPSSSPFQKVSYGEYAGLWEASGAYLYSVSSIGRQTVTGTVTLSKDSCHVIPQTKVIQLKRATRDAIDLLDVESGKAEHDVLSLYRPVELSVGNPPASISARTGSNISEKPFKEVVGKAFSLGEGCAGNPRFHNEYTIKSITVKNGKWVMAIDQYGPLDIHLMAPSSTWQADFLKTKPTHTTFTLSEDEMIDLQNIKGAALYASNGAYVPVFVTPSEVYFQYVGLSC